MEQTMDSLKSYRIKSDVVVIKQLLQFIEADTQLLIDLKLAPEFIEKRSEKMLKLSNMLKTQGLPVECIKA